jgi:curved DNA-binding protein CbpA
MSQHNLDINKYSLEEIFGLFDLTYDLTEESMRAAKKKVLMIHPDKSRLPPTYFHYYREAYDIVLNIYKQKARQTEGTTSVGNSATSCKPVYTPLNSGDYEPDISKKMAESAKGTGAFNSKFNELYDKNMVRKADTSRYDWFRQADSVYDDFSQKQVNPKNMGSELEAIKQKQAALQVYRGVQEMNASGPRGTSYFEEDDASSDYVSCDVFSKLKFDDLRKVHKDQSVFAVSESDLNKRTQYKSVDQFVRDRDGGVAPLSKIEATQLLERQQKEKEQVIMNKQRREYMLQKEYEEKQKSVRAAFLRLQ